MSFSNELEELLTGYIDNQLTADELRKVEAALLDPSVQAHLDELVRIRADLKSIAAISGSGLPADFAQRVLSLATESARSVTPSAAPNSAQRPSFKWASIVAGLAAAIALAVWIPRVWNQQDPIEIAHLVQPVQKDPVEDPAAETMLVSRNDLQILHILTFDVEVSAKETIADALAPLLRKNGIQLIKGAKVEGKVKDALDKIRVTVPPEDAPLPTEVYLLRAPNQSLEDVVERVWEDDTTFPTVRMGVAFELSSEPLLDKLSLDSSADDLDMSQLAGDSDVLSLSRSIAQAIQDQVDADDSFAAPITAAPITTANQQEFRASPFTSIPYQGKLVGSSARVSKSQATTESSADGETSFLLLFVRQGT